MSSTCRRDAYARRSVSSAADRGPTSTGDGVGRAPGGSARIAVPELGIRSGPVCSSYPYTGLKESSARAAGSHCQSSSRRRRTPAVIAPRHRSGERVHCRAIAPPAIAIAITFKVRVDRTWTGYLSPPQLQGPKVPTQGSNTHEIDGHIARTRRFSARPRPHTYTHAPCSAVRAVNESAGPTNVRCVPGRI